MAKQPIFIGGIGGSGTRSVVSVLGTLGLRTPDLVNDSLDFQWFAFLFKQPRFFHLHEKFSLDSNLQLFKKIMLGKILSEEDKQLIKNSQQSPQHPFSSVYFDKHVLKQIQVAKEPNMLYFTEELNALFPKSKFILVVRNPLEMAMSNNQQQFINWGANFGCTNLESTTERLQFWMEVHQYALQKLQQFYPNRFLILDYNSLGENPEKEIIKLSAFAKTTHSVQQFAEAIELIGYKAKEVDGVKQETDKGLLEEVMRFYEELKKN